MKYFIGIILFYTLFNSVYAQINQVNHQYENVLIHCPKNVTRPGAELDYKIYLTNRLATVNDLNNPVYVYLLDKDGNAVAGQFIKEAESSFTGKIRIPDEIPNDLYFLTAYTSLMRAKPVSSVFLHELIISNNTDDGLILHPSFNKPAYYPGDDMEMKIILSGNPENQNISYEIFSGTEKVISGKSEMNFDSMFIRFHPDKVYEKPLYVKLEIEYDAKLIYRIINLPIYNKTAKISFYTDQILENSSNPLIYTYTDMAGNGFSFKGDLVNRTAKIPVQSFTAGLGLLNIKPETGDSFFIESENYGFYQKFKIPEVSRHMVQVTLAGISDNVLTLNCNGPVTDSITLNVSNSFEEYYSVSFFMDKKSVVLKIPETSLPLGDLHAEVFSSSGEPLGSCYFMHLTKNTEYSKAEYSESGIDFSVTTANLQKLNLSAGTDAFPFEILPYSVMGIRAKLFTASFKSGNQKIADHYLSIIQNCLWNQVSLNRNDTSEFYNGIRAKAYKNNQVYQGEVEIQLHGTKVPFRTDAEGNILYTPEENIFDILSFSKGKNRMEIRTENSFNQKLMESFIPRYSFENKKRQWELMMQNGDLFKPANQVNTENYQNKEDYSVYTDMLDAVKSVKPFRLNSNRIIFQTAGSASAGNDEGALIVIDGIKMGMDISALTKISPTEVESIKIYTNLADIQMYTGFNTVGVIDIRTKRGYSLDKTEEKPVSDHFQWIPDLNSNKNKIMLKKQGDQIIYVAGFDPFGNLIMTGF